MDTKLRASENSEGNAGAYLEQLEAFISRKMTVVSKYKTLKVPVVSVYVEREDD